MDDDKPLLTVQGAHHKLIFFKSGGLPGRLLGQSNAFAALETWRLTGGYHHRWHATVVVYCETLRTRRQGGVPSFNRWRNPQRCGEICLRMFSQANSWAVCSCSIPLNSKFEVFMWWYTTLALILRIDLIRRMPYFGKWHGYPCPY